MAKSEPYGVRWTNTLGQATIYTHASAAAAKASLPKFIGSNWTSVVYVGKKW